MTHPDSFSKPTTWKGRYKHWAFVGVMLVIAGVTILFSFPFQPPQPLPASISTLTTRSSTSAITTMLPLIASSATTSSTDRLMAPDFSLQDVNGRSFRLSDFRGKVVVLKFMSTNCPHYKTEMPQLTAVWKRFEGRIVMISVSLNPHETDKRLSEYAESYSAPWIWARDTAGVGAAYQVTGVPTICIIDANGRIVYAALGETPETVLSQQIQMAMQG